MLILTIIISMVITIISIMFNLLFIQNLSKFQTFLPVVLGFYEYFPFCPEKNWGKVFFPGRILPVCYLGKYHPLRPKYTLK